VNTNRSYDDACGLARAMDVVGERWAMLLARELMLGPKRFTDLRADLPGVSTNVLSTRLAQLEQAGAVKRRKLPPPSGSWVYELTPWGLELEPIVRTLGRWGARTEITPKHENFSVTSAVLSMRTNFDPAAAERVRATYEIRLNDEVFRAEVRDGSFTIERGEAGRPDAEIETDPATLAAFLYQGLSLADAERAGMKVSGDARAVQRLPKLFVLPEPLPA